MAQQRPVAARGLHGTMQTALLMPQGLRKHGKRDRAWRKWDYTQAGGWEECSWALGGWIGFTPVGTHNPCHALTS